MRCPACGSKDHFQHPAHSDLFVCVGCGEVLLQTDMVHRSTKRSRRLWRKDNPL